MRVVVGVDRYILEGELVLARVEVGAVESYMNKLEGELKIFNGGHDSWQIGGVVLQGSSSQPLKHQGDVEQQNSISR